MLLFLFAFEFGSKSQKDLSWKRDQDFWGRFGGTKSFVFFVSEYDTQDYFEEKNVLYWNTYSA